MTLCEFSSLHLTDYSLVLRRWQIDDAPDIFKAVDKDRNHLEKWLPWVQDTRSVDNSLNFIRGSVAAFENGTKYEYGIFLRPIKDNTKWLLIGAIGVFSRSMEEVLELGYWLSKGMEGNGIVTFAVKTLMEEAKESLGVSRFFIMSHVDNWKSRRIPERLGFVAKKFCETKPTQNGPPSRLVEYQLELAC